MKIKENSGKSIQAISMLIMIMGIISSLLVAVFVSRLAYEITDFEPGVCAFVGFVVFGIGCFFSWTITQFIHGFGELVEYTAEAATYWEVIKEKEQI